VLQAVSFFQNYQFCLGQQPKPQIVCCVFSGLRFYLTLRFNHQCRTDSSAVLRESCPHLASMPVLKNPPFPETFRDSFFVRLKATLHNIPVNGYETTFLELATSSVGNDRQDFAERDTGIGRPPFGVDTARGQPARKR
jgi:hypothetical protein